MVALLDRPIPPPPPKGRPKHSAIVINDGEIGISLGNLKLPYTTAIWNLPAVTTCPGAFAQGCGLVGDDGIKRGHCYAIKAERMRPGVVAARERNLKVARTTAFLDRLTHLLGMVVKFRKIPVDKLRIHESGDFFSQAYLDAWLEAARRYPQLTFYSYTKSVRLDFSDRPANFVILLSDDKGIWESEWPRFDRIFRIEDPDADLWCGQDCTVCSACVSGPRRISIHKH